MYVGNIKKKKTVEKQEISREFGGKKWAAGAFNHVDAIEYAHNITIITIQYDWEYWGHTLNSISWQYTLYSIIIVYH